jgi:hypothetical protein
LAENIFCDCAEVAKVSQMPALGSLFGISLKRAGLRSFIPKSHLDLEGAKQTTRASEDRQSPFRPPNFSTSSLRHNECVKTLNRGKASK